MKKFLSPIILTRLINIRDRLYWGRSDVWNNDGDMVTLYDMNGEIVDMKIIVEVK